MYGCMISLSKYMRVINSIVDYIYVLNEMVTYHH